MPVYNHIPEMEDDMQGATSSAAGKAGLVPAPSAGDANRALMANGTWEIPTKAKDAEKLNGVPLYFPHEESFKEKASVLAAIINTFGEKVFNIPCKIQIVDENTDKVTGEIFTTTETVNGETKTTLTIMVEGYLVNDMVLKAKNVTTENDLKVKGTLDVSQIDAGTEYLQLFGKNSGVILANIVRTGSADAGPYFAPITTENTRLGHGNAKWSAVYAASPEIVTSDKNLKKNISSFTEAYEKLFFDLEPSIFKFKEGDSKRTHSGFISQDVEEALEKNGLSALDFAGFCKDPKTKIIIDDDGTEREVVIEGEYVYSLRYEEFIALNTHMIQKLYDKIENLEKKLKENGIEV